MKQLIYLLTLVLFTSVCYGQADNRFGEKIYGNASSMNTNEPAFLYKSFLPGTIQLIRGDVLSADLLNYNCVNDELMWLRTSPYQLIIVERSSIQGFTIKKSAETQQFKRIKSDLGKDSTIYMQLLCQGQVALYLHHKKQEYNNNYESYNIYYILKNDASLIKCKRSRKQLYSMYEELKPSLKSMFKAEHLYLKKESDLIRAIELLNKLL